MQVSSRTKSPIGILQMPPRIGREIPSGLSFFEIFFENFSIKFSFQFSEMDTTFPWLPLKVIANELGSAAWTLFGIDGEHSRISENLARRMLLGEIRFSSGKLHLIFQFRSIHLPLISRDDEQFNFFLIRKSMFIFILYFPLHFVCPTGEFIVIVFFPQFSLCRSIWRGICCLWMAISSRRMDVKRVKRRAEMTSKQSIGDASSSFLVDVHAQSSTVLIMAVTKIAFHFDICRKLLTKFNQ